MEDRIRLSRWLFSVLKRVGASERLRRLHRQTAVIEEIFTTVRMSSVFCKSVNIYSCGSSYEGSVTPALASDRDIIYCFSFTPVVLDAADSPPGMSWLMVRDSWTYPGYVKLQLVVDGRPQYGFHTLLPYVFDVDNVGRICFKNSVLAEKQGPADVYINADGVHVFDVVHAYRCDDIPQYALEWVMRPRPYGWPSPDQLQTMSRMGCMVVGVGHMRSGEKEIEWRMSYSLQERMLMSSLNPIQHKVYIILKMLKKNILGNVFHEETLTSYHLKTCVLFAVQMSPPRVWTQDNLIDCLIWCLKLMIKWLETNYCPSYLTKDQNLFMKVGFARVRWRVLNEMHKLVESGHQFLFMLQSDNVGDILKNGDWRMHREVTTQGRHEYMVNIKFNCARDLSISAINVIRFMSNGNYDPFTLTFVLENLKNTRHINSHTVEVIQSAMAHLFPWLHLHIANGLTRLTLTFQDRAVRERMMTLVDFHLHEARGIDLMNERLAAATVLYTFEKYEECSLLLHQLENDFTYQVTRMCPCTMARTEIYYDIQWKHERDKQIARMSIRQLMKSMTACCVIFLPSATAIAPEPLQYEMQRSLGTLPGSRDVRKDFWFDWAVVDAKVYLYLMQYLVNTKLHRDVRREVARDNLRAEIAEDDHRVMAGRKSAIFHKDTTYNLLGWIYMQEERFAEAYGCFMASWKIRAFHNAAKYHMRDLIVKLAERRVRH